jgi:hypothetical protein
MTPGRRKFTAGKDDVRESAHLSLPANCHRTAIHPVEIASCRRNTPDIGRLSYIGQGKIEWPGKAPPKWSRPEELSA